MSSWGRREIYRRGRVLLHIDKQTSQMGRISSVGLERLIAPSLRFVANFRHFISLKRNVD